MAGFKEFAAAEEEAKEARRAGEVPVLGDADLFQQKAGGLDNIEVKFITANMSDNNDKCLVEHVFTRSLRCQDQLEKPGDICVFREETAFTKEGDYLVSIKYAEVQDPDGSTVSGSSDQAGNFEM